MQPLSSVTHGKELYNTNSPSTSPVTVVKIIHLRMRVPRIAAATIQGRDHYRVCKTFVVLQLLLSTKNLTSRELNLLQRMI